MEIQLPNPRLRGDARCTSLRNFAKSLQDIQEGVDFKISARGWCYQLEQFQLVTKGQFNLVENAINTCRRDGFLPIDFTADEESRQFSGVETPEDDTPLEYLRGYLRAPLDCWRWYTPNWWEGEEYYIQMVVEKIDLKSLFEPVCKKYRIPIASAKGWSSMLMRAKYARRFKQAEEQGLECVLLYCGDFDPDGLRISEFLLSNLRDLKDAHWMRGDDGYDPRDLIVDRFGLNYDFIVENKLSWVENLETGSGGCFARMVSGDIVCGHTKQGKPHPNFHMDYMQEYLSKYGVRKCEANAIVIRPDEARELCRQAIEAYVGDEALDRFKAKRQAIGDEMREFRERTGLQETIEGALDMMDEELGK